MTRRQADRESLLLLVEGRDGGRDLLRQALAELRARCPECSRNLAAAQRREEEQAWTDPSRFPLWLAERDAAGSGLAPPAPDAAGERLAAARLDLRLLLRKRTLRARLDSIRRAHKRMNRPELVDLLLGAARSKLDEEPLQAMPLLDAAAEVAKRVPDQPPGVVPRLKLRIDAHRANALRVLGDLPAAAEIWERVHEQLVQWPLATPGAEAELWRMEASLRRALRQFDEAEPLLARAESLFRLAGDTEGLVRVYLNRGTLAEYRGDSLAGLLWTEKATALVDAVSNPRLFWNAHHNLADSLLNLGRPADAEAVLGAAQPALRRCADASTRLHLDWLAGKIHFAAGRTAEAEGKLRTVCTDCSRLGLAFDAALAGLDLCDLFLATDRPQLVTSYAKAMVKLFQARGVHREAIAAANLFAATARAGRVNPPLVAKLRTYLVRAQMDPALVFDPEACAG